MHDSTFSALQPGTPSQWGSERILPAERFLLRKGSAMLFSTQVASHFILVIDIAIAARQVLLDMFTQQKENKTYLGCLSPLNSGS